ncbi:MAG: hypothetical protein K0R66_541 [Gammaproteobacteria bacterium]|jgi:hypothetical protein|nr:hypothetical protein [Gammaproteobacteria bacterium]
MPKTQNELNQSLLKAVEADDVPAIKAAIQEGADIRFRAYADYTLLHVAAVLGKVNSIRALVKIDPKLMNQRDSSQARPLATAASNGKTESIKTLVELGDSVNIIDKTDTPPLLSAYKAGQLESYKILLALGAVVFFDIASSINPAFKSLTELAEDVEKIIFSEQPDNNELYQAEEDKAFIDQRLLHYLLNHGLNSPSFLNWVQANHAFSDEFKAKIQEITKIALHVRAVIHLKPISEEILSLGLSPEEERQVAMHLKPRFEMGLLGEIGMKKLHTHLKDKPYLKRCIDATIQQMPDFGPSQQGFDALYSQVNEQAGICLGALTQLAMPHFFPTEIPPSQLATAAQNFSGSSPINRTKEFMEMLLEFCGTPLNAFEFYLANRLEDFIATVKAEACNLDYLIKALESSSPLCLSRKTGAEIQKWLLELKELQKTQETSQARDLESSPHLAAQQVFSGSGGAAGGSASASSNKYAMGPQ